MLLSSILVGMAALTMGADAATANSQTTAKTTAKTTSDTATRTAATSTESATSSSSTAATTHSVAVGANGNKYEPNVLTNVSVGDIVLFRFYPTGHWVVRAEYKQPCIPYENTGPNKIGFESGQINVATTSDDGPTFEILINDTAPIFFYCAASGSCVDNYMIGVINPNETQTYEVQLEYAKNATTQMTPGEAFASETASGSKSTSTSSTSTGSSSGSGSISAGAIAGITIGAAFVVVLAAALIYLFGRRGGQDKAYLRHARDPYLSNMVDPKYGGVSGTAGPSAPKSPGQETFVTTAYSTTPSHDPYQTHILGQAMPLGYPTSAASPPPMSVRSQSSRQHYGGGGHMGSPSLNAIEVGNTMNPGYTSAVPQQNPYPSHPYAAAVELPTSSDPGSTPLPNYNNTNTQRTFSWLRDSEGSYGSGKP